MMQSYLMELHLMEYDGLTPLSIGALAGRFITILDGLAARAALSKASSSSQGRSRS